MWKIERTENATKTNPDFVVRIPAGVAVLQLSPAQQVTFE